MRLFYLGAILSFMALASCKKKKDVYVTMVVNPVGDSSWTATEVTTEYINEVVYITGKNPSLDKKVELIIEAYEPGNHSYTIHFSGSLANMHECSAQYQSGTTVAVASGGQIATTNSTTQTVEGTFDFEGGGVHASGTFIAPKP